ncbi:MAG: hypothetical protein HGB10_02530 [Coriobacteriia bacterium]|nr:hypothetical protein [Coriobacteriia bacterium]
MSDDTTTYDQEVEEPPEEEKKPRRSLLGIIVAIIAIVVIILVLLMLRDCSSMFSGASKRSGAQQIVPVEGKTPLDGSISVWLEAGADVQRALSDARISSSEIIDMGGGRFVVTVPAGSEVDSVERLKKVEGVADSGRVYQD